MTPNEFILLLMVFLFAWFGTIYVGHRFVAFMSRTEFYPWMMRSRYRRRK